MTQLTLPSLEQILKDRTIPNLVKGKEGFVPEYGYSYKDGFNQKPRMLLGITINIHSENDELKQKRVRLKFQESELMRLQKEKKELKQKCANEEIEIDDYEKRIDEIRLRTLGLKQLYAPALNEFLKESQSKFNEMYHPFIKVLHEKIGTSPMNYYVLSRIFQEEAIVFDDDNIQRNEYYERIIQKMRDFKSENQVFFVGIEDYYDRNIESENIEVMLFSYLLGYKETFISTGVCRLNLETQDYTMHFTCLESAALLKHLKKEPVELEIIRNIYPNKNIEIVSRREYSDISNQMRYSSPFSSIFSSNNHIRLQSEEKKTDIETDKNPLKEYEDQIEELAKYVIGRLPFFGQEHSGEKYAQRLAHNIVDRAWSHDIIRKGYEAEQKSKRDFIKDTEKRINEYIKKILLS